MIEVWRPVVGYEGLYEVSDRGRVRGVDRVVRAANGGRRQAGVLLKQSVDRRWAYVGLRAEGRSERVPVHRLVLEAFVGACPPGLEALHGGAGTLCNELSNLRWDTRAENNRDLVRQNKHHYARRSTCARGHDLKPRSGGRRYCPACQRDDRAAKRGAAA